MTAPTANHFFTLAGRDGSNGDIVVKTINVSSVPVNATMNISGAANLAGQAQLTELTSARLTDNNSLENPATVIPMTSQLVIPGPEFTHSFPANSLTVLRLKTNSTLPAGN